MKKNLFYILIIITLIGYFNPASKLRAQTDDPVGTCTFEDSGLGSDATTASECAELGGSWTGPYVLLAPLPDTEGGQLTTFDTVGENKIGAYLNLMIKLFIGICAVLAVIMIVIGGIEYMTSELISNKEEGKKRITQAILGLLLALGAYLILWTINPEILNTDLKSLESVTVEVDLEADVPQTYDPVTKKYPNGALYGAPWDDTVGALATLPAYVTVSNRQCTFIGDTNCTSTRKLNTSTLQSVQWGCKCNLTITGGTESWLHGGKTGSTSHALGSSTVDLHETSELTNYITGGKTPTPNTRYSQGNVSFLYENNNGVTHWHVGP